MPLFAPRSWPLFGACRPARPVFSRSLLAAALFSGLLPVLLSATAQAADSPAAGTVSGSEAAQTATLQARIESLRAKGRFAAVLPMVRSEAENGNVAAATMLGSTLLSRPDRGSRIAGCEWLDVARERGGKNALMPLANCFRFGIGRTQDPEQAISLIREAADAGQPDALCAWGSALARGQTVNADPDKGVALCEQAASWQADDDSKAAQRQAAMIRAEAMAALSALYLDGKALPRQPEKALDWLKKAVEEGHGQAAYNLSVMYQLGDGVEKDLAEAEKWAEKAIARRYPPAWFLLGKMLADQHIDLKTGKVERPAAERVVEHIGMAGYIDPDPARRAWARQFLADLLEQMPDYQEIWQAKARKIERSLGARPAAAPGNSASQ